MEVSDVKKMKDMEAELAQYKKNVAELTFENSAIKAVIEKKLQCLLTKERLLIF